MKILKKYQKFKYLLLPITLLSMMPTAAWSSCTDNSWTPGSNAVGASARDGDTCYANQTSYMGRWPVYAIGQGSILNFTQETVTVQGYPYNAHHIIAMGGSQINFNNLNLKLDTYVGTANGGVRGIYAGKYTATNDIPANVTINGDFTARLETTDSIHAAVETDNAYSVIIKGKTDIVLNKNVENAIVARNNSTIYFGGDTKIHSLNNNLTAETSSNITIDGAVDFLTTQFRSNVYARSGGQIFLNGGGNIISQVNGGNALNANGANSLISAQNVSITTSGDNNEGLYTINNATIIFKNGTIQTEGEYAYAAYAGAGSHIIFEGGSVTTNGKYADGFRATDDNSLITINSANIRTNGLNAIGAFAELGSKITLTNSTITTTGDESRGLAAEDDGSILQASSVSIQTSGSKAFGIGASRGGSSTIINSTITVNGENAYGLAAYENGTLNVENTAITTSGKDSAAIYAGHWDNGTEENIAKDNNISVSGSSIIAENGDVIRAEGVSLNLNFKDITTVEAKAGNLLHAMDDDMARHSRINFNAQNSDIIGNIIVDDQNIANIALVSSRLTGQAINATNVSLDTNSLWNVTASSTISQELANNGTIAFQVPTANNFKNLQTQNYSTNNGTIHFNTALGDDSSQTDRLIVENNTTGTGNISVTNIGGTGAQTLEGIKLIEVNGRSNAMFTMINGDTTYNGQQAMVAGAYIYSLYQGGASTPDDGNWYLRSVTEQTKRIYQPGVPIYEAYPQTLLALNALPTLQQRVGNRSWLQSNASVDLDSIINSSFASDTTGFWIKMEGGYNKVDPKHSTTDTKFDQNTFRMQAGIDAPMIETPNNTLIAGINVQYTRGKANSDWHWSDLKNYGDGTVTTDGYGFGGTLTWYNDTGFYIDSQTQLTWFNSDLQSKLDNKNLVNGNRGFGYALSAEAGKKIAIGNSLNLTPQAQLMYSNIDFKSFNDRYNTRVNLNSADSLQTRIGLALERERTAKGNNGLMNRSLIYGIANIYYEFLDGSEVNVSDAKFVSQLDKWSAGIGFGGSYNFADDKYSIYGEASANTSLENIGNSYSLKGNLGFRSKF
ncbi:autotransporter outer membrane beta-barrel domain-containing protein [Bartonella sp. HY329]|uniref:autotransporter family protein n=1 Tax=unclassified Bartonella TaxID=2645622 RepID=UPI0021CAAA88|nr:MULTISPECIES: autotransporter outer membrane beta-barrel domain-containing protein [unclassified Bartonella]UXM95628.1 autotransporter outer membrane beta-barrel domain-containing protein [Bartonella sp. HY329]UXN09953.1 autotransporter outer membrane beta-barrel domain-containing protein [Bartonella sp. HY328]